MTIKVQLEDDISVELEEAVVWTFTAGGTVELVNEDGAIIAEFNRDKVLFVRRVDDRSSVRTKFDDLDTYHARSSVFQ